MFRLDFPQMIKSFILVYFKLSYYITSILRVRFPSRCSSRLNQDVKDLIWRLICVDVKARMHVSMLHLHQWMRSKPTQDRSNFKTQLIPAEQDRIDADLKMRTYVIGPMILIYSNFDLDRSTSRFWSNRGLKS